MPGQAPGPAVKTPRFIIYGGYRRKFQFLEKISNVSDFKQIFNSRWNSNVIPEGNNAC